MAGPPTMPCAVRPQSNHMPTSLLARLSIAASATAMLALLALHALRADLSPATHMISEYAVGAHGWVMLCFNAFALASLALLGALATRVRGVTGWLGLACLLVTAAGLAIGGAFPMDPTTNDPALMSRSGQLAWDSCSASPVSCWRCCC
ncbi:MAG: DUF998 domain-containing protein [Gemmatimonadetes bacterium]|nr:DUF998 domain-containing protein [Gemmatimonadota bacterium]